MNPPFFQHPSMRIALFSEIMIAQTSSARRCAIMPRGLVHIMKKLDKNCNATG